MRSSLEVALARLRRTLDSDQVGAWLECDFLYEPDPEYTRILEEGFGQLPFPAYPARGFEGTRWFLGADVLLRDEEDCVPVRARTEDALEAVRALLPGDWLNG